MDENKIVDVEFEEVNEAPADETPEPKKEVDICPAEDLIDLLDEVNHLVNGYSEILQASKDMMYKLKDKGYTVEKAVEITTILSKRASDKAGAIVGHGEKKGEDAE